MCAYLSSKWFSMFELSTTSKKASQLTAKTEEYVDGIQMSAVVSTSPDLSDRL